MHCQVLELAILHAQDIKALAGASTVNNHFHDFVQDAARLHPHALLAAWTESATATRKAPPAKLRHGQQQLDDCRLKCLLWLCRAVGEEFVNSHGVASALLRLTKTVPDLKPDDLVEVLREAGEEDRVCSPPGTTLAVCCCVLSLQRSSCFHASCLHHALGAPTHR